MQKSHCRQRLRERRICVIIPTYNNAGTVIDVAKRTLEYCDDLIIVNDGSTDSTAQFLQNLNGADIVTLPQNCGKGTALKRGFMRARQRGFSYAITLDADAQHFPEDIPALLEANIKHPDAIIVGCRNFGDAVRSKGSMFANAFSNFWFCVQTLRRIPDTQSGFRLYPLRKLYGLPLLTSRYEAELELLVFASWHGVRIATAEVNVYYPPAEERVSHFRPGKDFARISILNTCLCFLAVIYAFPLGLLRFLRSLSYTCFALCVYVFGTLGVVLPFTLVYAPLCKARRRPPILLHSLLHWFGKKVTYMLGLFGAKINVIRDGGQAFSSPTVITCNHQSHLDLMALLGLTEKIVFLTNDWVWRSPFFGYIVRSAQYYPVSAGIEVFLPNLKALAEDGYSICVFPEGTRSADGEIMRFHKGAFHLAVELGIPLTPIVLYGASRVLPKGTWWMHRWPMAIKIFDSVRLDPSIPEREICKEMRKFYKSEYQHLCDKFDCEA